MAGSAAEESSISGRLGGLFRARSTTNVKNPLQDEVHALQAQVQELTTAQRAAREHAQQVELEKKLLENFVNQIMAHDDDDAAAKQQAQESVATTIAKSAELTLALERARQAKEELEGQLHRAEKKCAAFESALNNAQEDLKAADARFSETAAELATLRGNDATVRRLTDELDAKTTTLTEVMGRVAKMDADRKQAEADFAAILAKTQAASDAALEELEASKAQCRALTAEVDRLKEAAAAPPAAQKPAAATAPQVDVAAVEQRAAAAVRAECDAKVRALQQQLDEAHGARARDAAVLQALEAEAAKLRDALKQRDDDAEGLRDQLGKKEAALAATEAAMHEAVTAAKDAAAEAASQLEALRAELEAARGEAAAAKLDAAEGLEAVAELDALRDALRSRDEALAEYETKLGEIEAEARAKARNNANVIRDLQQQVLRLQRGATSGAASATHSDPTELAALAASASPARRGASSGSTVTPPPQQQQPAKPKVVSSSNTDGSGGGDGDAPATNDELLAENLHLVDRVATLQQEVWVLGEAKRSYEEEMARLHDELAAKRAIITAHFIETAQRYNKEKGKFGASFFKPSQEDVVARMQASLEEALEDAMRLQNELREDRRSLDRALRVIERAEAEGFVVVDDELDPDADDDLDDSYEGTFE